MTRLIKFSQDDIYECIKQVEDTIKELEMLKTSSSKQNNDISMPNLTSSYQYCKKHGSCRHLTENCRYFKTKEHTIRLKKIIEKPWL